MSIGNKVDLLEHWRTIEFISLMREGEWFQKIRRQEFTSKNIDFNEILLIVRHTSIWVIIESQSFNNLITKPLSWRMIWVSLFFSWFIN